MKAESSLDFDGWISSAIPDAYAAYRRPVAEALKYFLATLRPSRSWEIVAEQIAFPAETPPAKRLAALARHCPVWHKLGQVLARDRRLDPGLRAELQTLESLPPTTPIAGLRREIEEELGDFDRLGFELGAEVLAEGSVAAVVPIVDSLGRPGVLKVLKPGIEEKLDEELDLLDQIGTLLDDQCADLGLHPLDYRDTFAQARELLEHEVRLDLERKHLIEAAEDLRRLPDVRVPSLLPWHGRRVLAMERIDGWKVTEPAGLDRSSRKGLANQIVEALIATPLWSAKPLALFHGDPHAGNLLRTKDETLVPLDWSLAAHLDLPAREAGTAMAVAALVRDAASLVNILARLSIRPPNMVALREIVASRLSRRPVLDPPGLTWAMALMDEAVARAGLRAPPSLLAFRKALFTMEGVISELSPGFDLDFALISSFCGRLVRESPWRIGLSPWSRALPSRLAGIDVARIALAAPGLMTLAGLELAGPVLSMVRPDSGLNTE